MLSERLKERLKNLAELRDRDTTNPNEAHAAARAIARLLAKEGLSEDDVCFEDGDVDDEISSDHTFIEVKTRIQDWMSIMCCDLAILCGCYPARIRFRAGREPIQGWNLTPGKRYSSVAVWGRARDIQILQALYPAFKMTVESLSKGQIRRDIRNYRIGAWNGIHWRMRQSQNLVMEEIKKSAKTAIAPVEWHKKAEKVANNSVKIGSGRKVSARKDKAYIEGVNRGMSQKIPGEQQAITGQMALGAGQE